MTELAMEEFERVLGERSFDEPMHATPVPEFVDAAARRAWIAAYVGALVAAQVIVDDAEERALAVELVERQVPLSLARGSLLRYLLFAGLAEGCHIVSVGIDLTGSTKPLADLVGAGLPHTDVAVFQRNGLSGCQGLMLDLLPVGGDRVRELSVACAHAAARRDIGDWVDVPVRASMAGVDVALICAALGALQEIVTDQGLPARIGAVLDSITRSST